MPWCPICKNEYREGFTVCKECGVPLVDELPGETNLSEVVILESKVLAERFISYLDYELGEGASFEEMPDHTWRILIEDRNLKKAKKCFQAFYIVEAQEFARQEAKKAAQSGRSAEAGEVNSDAADDMAQTGDSDASDGTCKPDETCGTKESDGEMRYRSTEEFSEFKMSQEGNAPSETDGPEDDSDEDDSDYDEEDGLDYDEAAKNLLSPEKEDPMPSASAFVKKSEQEKDLKSTAVTFFVIGAAGIVFLVFNLLGYFPMFDSIVSNIVFAVMFTGCLLVGFNSLKRAKKAAAEVSEEEALTERINSWIRDHITKELLSAQRSQSLTEEANFLKELEYLKVRITEEFGELDETYLDYIAEEYYNSHFETEV